MNIFHLNESNNRLTVVSDIYDPLRMADELEKFEAAQRKVPVKSPAYQGKASIEWRTFVETLADVICASNDAAEKAERLCHGLRTSPPVEVFESDWVSLPIDVKVDRGPSVQKRIWDDYAMGRRKAEVERHMRFIEDKLRDNVGQYVERGVGKATHKKKGKARRTS